MVLDFKLIQRKEMWCAESAAASIATMFNRGFELMFSELWMFEVLPEDPKHIGMIGNRICSPKSRSFELLEKYHGISTNYIKVSDSRKILDIAKAEINAGRAVLVSFDSFHSPWAPEFEKKNRFISAYVILGVDDKNEGVFCFDIHYLRRLEFLPISNFINGAKSVMTYALTEIKEYEFDWCELINSCVDQLYKTPFSENSFDAIRKFAQCLVNNLNFEIEFEGKKDYSGMNDMHTVPLLKNLTAIRRNRGLFAMALQYIGTKYKQDELINISQRVEIIGSKWSQVFSLVNKGVFSSSFNEKLKQNLFIRLNEIANYEENLANSLRLLTQNHSFQKKKNSCIVHEVPVVNNVQDSNEDIVFVDIKNYMDNKGIYSEVQDSYKSGLNGVGDYLVLNQFPFGNELVVGNSKFFTPVISENLHDNISCNDQIINIMPDFYTRIMLLGCSDFMNHYESMKIIYSDDEVEEVPLQFSYWFYPPRYGEQKAWSGLLIRKMVDSDKAFSFSANIFSQSYNLGRNKIVKGIHLPQCPDIHLFAISLGKKR